MAGKKNVIINSVPLGIAKKFEEKADFLGITKTEFFCILINSYNEKFKIVKENNKKTEEMGFDDKKPYTGVPIFKN